MDKHRKETGIEGSWSSYFELLKQALDNKSIGLNEIKDGSGGLSLKIHYPLMAGARISGQIEFRGRTTSSDQDEIRGLRR